MIKEHEKATTPIPNTFEEVRIDLPEEFSHLEGDGYILFEVYKTTFGKRAWCCWHLRIDMFPKVTYIIYGMGNEEQLNRGLFMFFANRVIRR